MTRKKSNVKALALAVTCAILAGGYSGLNPVYAAADKLYKDSDKVTTVANVNEITELTVGGVTIGGGGKINGSEITVSGSASVGSFSVSGASTFNGATTFSGTAAFGGQSTFNAEILADTIKEATTGNGVTVGGVKFSNNDINTTGAITASSLKLTGTNPVSDVGKAINDNTTNIARNKTNINSLDGKIDTVNTHIRSDMANEVSTINTKIDTKLDTSTFGAYKASNDAAVNELKNKTKNIRVAEDTMVPSSDATYIDGITHAGGVRLADKKVRAEELVLEEKFANGNAAEARLTREGLAALNSMVYDANGKINNGTDGKPIIQAGNGSVVGGVTFDNKQITNVNSITVNEGKENQVQITSEGIVVGLTSAAINGDGFYAGGHNYNDAKAALDGKDGKIKGAGGKFGVDEYGNVTTTANIKGKDITAEGNLTVDGDAEVKKDLKVTGNIVGQDITANGALKGKTLGIGGTANDKFTVDEDGAVKAAGGKVEIDKTGKATFGDTAGGITKIEGQKITTGSIVANDTTVESTISGVKMKNGLITADSMKITGTIDLNDLTVNNKLTVGTFSVDKDGVVGGVKSINGANVTASGTGLTIGSATVGAANPFSSTGFTVDATGNITAGTYNGNTIGADNKFNGVELKGGDVKATKVTADTITDGTAIMTGGTVTANTITVNTSASLAGVTFDASGVDFKGKDIKNVANVTATTAKLGNLSIAGHVIKNDVEAGGPIGLGTTVTVNNAGELGGITKIDGVNVIDNAGGLAIGTGATQVTIGGTDAISVGTGTFTVDGAGLVTGNQFATTNGSYLKDNELKLNAANIWNTTEGLKAEKAVIGANTLDAAGISTTGTLGVKGQATFGHSTSGNYTTVNGGKVDITANGGTTTIEGAKITTETLDVKDIILRNKMQDVAGNTITIKGSDGSMSVAGGAFAVDKEGQLTNKITGTAGGFSYETNLETSKSGIKANYTNAINGNQNTIDMGASGISIGVSGTTPSVGAGFKAELEKATMGYGTENSIVVNKDTITSALGTDVTRVMTNSAAEQSIVDKVGTTTVTTKSGGTTFGNNTANNTLIYGSAITSTNGGATGVLDGSNLTLKNGANSTALNAGGATFTGAAGEKGGKVTTINGGTITTDTLNVERINLGEDILDSNGTPHGSNLSMDKQGNFSAAGGNFKVTGGTGADKGAFTNTVGNTTLQTDNAGASMKYNNGTVESNVSVGDNSAMISAGASSIEVKNDGITNNGKTTFKGAVDATVPTTETTINGNTITTGHLITDRLTITGSGAAAGAGTGTIALGGNGSIKSNIQDASGTKEATFETEFDHIKSEVTDGTTTTKNEVKASGNTNKVTEIATSNNTESYQTATSIGGVVTNGTVKMKQELTAEGVKVTDELGDPANYTQITNQDVSITDQKNPGKRINLSDLGQLNNLDGELTARDEYKNNAKTKETAVGAINAEAAIRREEVARLDNRIDDVNNRVDKVGAMAAAIASLKSIGYDPQAPSEFSIGLGQYKGETGVAMGFFHYPNKNFMINVSLSTAGGETMGGIGATWRFGHKSPQKLLEEQREAQARKELAAAEKYQAAAKLAKEAQERAEYAAKLARQAQVSADNAKAAADATQAKHFQ